MSDQSPNKFRIDQELNVDVNEDLQAENKKLRRKLKQLSAKLDDQLQRAVQTKLKMQNIKLVPSPESQSLELQNAYRMIERLQKTVKSFQSKQSYQVTLKRVLDLESVIHKKDAEMEELKSQLKTVTKTLKDKQKYIVELLENSKKPVNYTEDLDVLNKLKTKLRSVTVQNELLRRKQLQKHQKLVKAQRKIVQIEQNQYETPIGRQQSMVKDLQQAKNRMKDAMLRVQRQNLYIRKLNEKLAKQQNKNQRQRKKVSKSVQQLPQLKKQSFEMHLPIKLNRY